jgi:ABC-2 type transport system permease protein
VRRRARAFLGGAGILIAFIRRDLATARSYRAAYAIELVAILFSVTLFFYLSRLIDGNSTFAHKYLLGHGYFGYVIIGLALLRVVHTSLSSFATRLRSDQTTGTLEALFASPASPSLVIVSSAAFDILRATLLGVSMVLVAVIVFGLHLGTSWEGAGALILALPACIAVFAAIGVALAAFTVVFKQTTSLISLISNGLGLLAGVYFPIKVFPPALRAVANATPFTWAVEVVRDALLGNHIPPGELIGLLITALLLLPLALLLFGVALARARREGSLAHY